METTERKPVTKPSRFSGILVHPTSFPSPYGIGDLGPAARDFIDFLARTGQHLWQVLPLGPTGFGDSPYQSFSSFAGQPLLISPDLLVEAGLLTKEDLAGAPEGDPRRVDYGAVIGYKNGLFRKAYDAFAHTPDKTMIEDFNTFCVKQREWLDDYALFMAGKDAHEGRCWLDWEDDLRTASPAAQAAWTKKLADSVRYYKFLQFLFQVQWDALRAYARENEVEIIGDIPIFVSTDSCDIWADRDLFQVDTKGYPTSVAGVPPDYFSATGQLWGNPLYDWDKHEATGFTWWIRRIRRQLTLVDHLRIDHFRGFEAYWSVPADEETALNGAWVKGPGDKLFRALSRVLGSDLPILAEDLGLITPEVEALRDSLGFPGMKVLQFGFENMEDDNYIPHFYTTPNCVCYTGTHDNDTVMGWYASQPEEVRDRVRRYGNTDGNMVSLDFIRFAMASIARFCIFPIQDLLLMGSDARMNRPGEACANWSFRYLAQDLTQDRADWLAATTKLFGR